jgi:3-hydroxy-3-methylglutaryl CoA synthase
MSATATDTSGKYVSSVAVTLGTITISYGNQANAVIANQTLGLTPYETGDKSVAWRCGAAALPTGQVLLGTNTTQAATYVAGTLAATNLQKYLPKACRA